MALKYMKRCMYSFPLRKCKLKLYVDSLIFLSNRVQSSNFPTHFVDIALGKKDFFSYLTEEVQNVTI